MAEKAHAFGQTLAVGYSGLCLTEQQIKCLMGEHEDDLATLIEAVEGEDLPYKILADHENSQDILQEDAVSICKHCRCLYVEKP